MPQATPDSKGRPLRHKCAPDTAARTPGVFTRICVADVHFREDGQRVSLFVVSMAEVVSFFTKSRNMQRVGRWPVALTGPKRVSFAFCRAPPVMLTRAAGVRVSRSSWIAKVEVTSSVPSSMRRNDSSSHEKTYARGLLEPLLSLGYWLCIGKACDTDCVLVNDSCRRAPHTS